MTPAETAQLLALVAAYDRRTIGRADVQAWHVVLAEVSYDDARTVVTGHYATQTAWIMPAHIVDGVRRIRSERLAGLDALLPDADPDDIHAWLKAYRRQIADAAAGREPVTMQAITGPTDTEGVAKVVAELARLKDLATQAEDRERAADAARAAAMETERARQLDALTQLPTAETEATP